MRSPGGTARLAAPRLALPLLAVLALLLRLPRFGRSLWFDEVWYSTHQLWRSWPDLMRSIVVSKTSPLYRLLLFGWVELFGEGEVALRLPPLLFGIGSILLVYQLVRRRSGDAAGLLAGLVLAFSPAHVWYSQEATPYALTPFLLVAAALLADRLVSEPFSPARLGLFALALGAACFTHYFATAFVVPFGLLALTARGRSRLWMTGAVIAAGLAVAGVLVVKELTGHLDTGQSFLRAFTPGEAWQLVFHWFPEGNALWTVGADAASPKFLLSHPLLLACQLFAGVLLLRGLFAGEGRTARVALIDTAFLATLPVALALLGWIGFRHLYIERYLLVVLPFFVALEARGAWSIRGRAPRLAASAALVALTAAAWLGWWQKPGITTVHEPNPDWRAAARLLIERTPANDRALVAGAVPLDALAFYVRRLGGDSQLVVDDPKKIRNAGHGFLRGQRIVHLIRDRLWKGDFVQLQRSLERDPRWRLVGQAEVFGVDVFSYERN